MDGKKRSDAARRRRRILWAGSFGAGVLFLCFFPPVRFLSLDAAREQQDAETFDPRAFAERFWEDRLLQSLDRAVDAQVLLAAIAEDPAAARKRYGRTMGFGSRYYCYFLAGACRVVSVTGDTVGLAVGEEGRKTDLVIETSAVFGNAVRDGTGLIAASAFSNSQDFNAISLEINRLVETRVLAPFRRQAAAGVRVKLVGCAEVRDEKADLDPLRVVPIVAEVKP
jgi:predicted lipoprotein